MTALKDLRPVGPHTFRTTTSGRTVHADMPDKPCPRCGTVVEPQSSDLHVDPFLGVQTQWYVWLCPTCIWPFCPFSSDASETLM